jgi:hypothetical protein
MTFVYVILGLLSVAAGLLLLEVRRRHMSRWLGAWLRGEWRPTRAVEGTRHLMFCFVDHFEPRWNKASLDVERHRVRRWQEEYPRLCSRHRDADGRPPVHTFFFPEEEYRPEHIEALVGLCRAGLGEIEVHLHHDNDTGPNLRRTLDRFTRTLADEFGALPVDPRTGRPAWAFVHGNWCLDNSRPDGRMCGVNDEITILRDAGCYADFTFPSAPDASQPSTINQIYYATDDPDRPNSHDRGQRVRAGGGTSGDLMIVQGPLGLQWRNRKFGLVPRIENADIRRTSPPTDQRIDAWVRTGIHVEGRPDWVFVKIHTHGTQDSDIDVLLGDPMDRAFSYLESRYNDGERWKLHYVSAREAYNIVKAAEAGHDGDPGRYRDFLIPRPSYRRETASVGTTR